MGYYRNFTLDFPSRMAALDKEFKRAACSQELEVTYLLMKLTSAFVLPFERVRESSGVNDGVAESQQDVSGTLCLEMPFIESPYCLSSSSWHRLSANNFSVGPEKCDATKRQLSSDVSVRCVLNWLRNGLAHSNLFFGGMDSQIEHVYIGKLKDSRERNDHYHVLRCDVAELEHLVDVWIKKLSGIHCTAEILDE